MRHAYNGVTLDDTDIAFAYSYGKGVEFKLKYRLEIRSIIGTCQGGEGQGLDKLGSWFC